MQLFLQLFEECDLQCQLVLQLVGKCGLQCQLGFQLVAIEAVRQPLGLAHCPALSSRALPILNPGPRTVLLPHHTLHTHLTSCTGSLSHSILKGIVHLFSMFILYPRVFNS